MPASCVLVQQVHLSTHAHRAHPGNRRVALLLERFLDCAAQMRQNESCPAMLGRSLRPLEAALLLLHGPIVRPCAEASAPLHCCAAPGQHAPCPAAASQPAAVADCSCYSHCPLPLQRDQRCGSLHSRQGLHLALLKCDGGGCSAMYICSASTAPNLCVAPAACTVQRSEALLVCCIHQLSLPCKLFGCSQYALCGRCMPKLASLQAASTVFQDD